MKQANETKTQIKRTEENIKAKKDSSKTKNIKNLLSQKRKKNVESNNDVNVINSHGINTNILSIDSNKSKKLNKDDQMKKENDKLSEIVDRIRIFNNSINEVNKYNNLNTTKKKIDVKQNEKPNETLYVNNINESIKIDGK